MNLSRIILSAGALVVLTMSSFGQGIVFEDNSGASYDTILNGFPNYTQNLNLELLFGTTATSVNLDVVTLLLNSSFTPTTGALGQVGSAAGDISLSGGYIYDPSGQEYLLSAYAGDTVYLQVLA